MFPESSIPMPGPLESLPAYMSYLQRLWEVFIVHLKNEPWRPSCLHKPTYLAESLPSLQRSPKGNVLSSEYRGLMSEMGLTILHLVPEIGNVPLMLNIC